MERGGGKRGVGYIFVLGGFSGQKFEILAG
jgi:hypothetical protein